MRGSDQLRKRETLFFILWVGCCIATVLDSPENMLVLQRASGNKNQRVMFNFGTKDALFEGEKVEALSSVFGQPMPG